MNVTDLHGDVNKYKKILEIVIEEGIKMIIHGGDMLPKHCNRYIEQPIFINGFSKDYFIELEKYHISYLTMLGNDDLIAVDECFGKLCSEFNHVNNMAGK